MIDIRPAMLSDREAVLGYLRSAQQSARAYEKLFDYGWRKADWNAGYLIADDNAVKGFIGHVYSERAIRGSLRRLANQTTWSVDPGYRRYSLDLLQASLREPCAVITNFSANETARRILQAYKFRQLDSGKVVVSPHHGLFDLSRTRIVAADGKSASLDVEQRRIVADHLALGCRAFIVENGGQGGLVVTLRRLFKGIPYADVLHSSAPLAALLSLGPYLAWHDRVVALGIPRRFVAGEALLIIDNRRPTFYASADLGPDDIDTLYSEFPLLYGSPRPRDAAKS